MEIAHLSGPNYGMTRSVVARNVAGLLTQQSRHGVLGMLAHRDDRQFATHTDEQIAGGGLLDEVTAPDRSLQGFLPNAAWPARDGPHVRQTLPIAQSNI